MVEFVGGRAAGQAVEQNSTLRDGWKMSVRRPSTAQLKAVVHDRPETGGDDGEAESSVGGGVMEPQPERSGDRGRCGVPGLA